MRIIHNYPQNVIFLYHNLKLHKMIDIYLKFDNMHTNKIFNALICINTRVNSCTNCMLSHPNYIHNVTASSYEINMLRSEVKKPSKILIALYNVA